MKQFLQYGFLSTLLVSQGSMANLPEPDVIFYGKVASQVGATTVALTEGSLEWTIRSLDGSAEVYTFTAELESLADGAYSYKISIPQQLLAPSEHLVVANGNVMTLESGQDLSLRHYEISLNGYSALLDDEKLSALVVSEENRSSHRRLDLTVSGKVLGELSDADGDGLPDIWEQQFGFDVATGNATEDPDGDGWSNAEEFERGTDPNVNNRVPVLVGEAGQESLRPTVTVYESGLAQLRLKVVDSDSQQAELSVVIEALPEGISVYLADAIQTPLAVGQSLSGADFEAGNVFIRHTLAANGESVSGALRFSINDSGPAHTESVSSNPAIQSEIDLTLFNPASVASPTRWIDGQQYRGQSVSQVEGRSGHGLDSLSSYTYEGASDELTSAAVQLSVDEAGLIQSGAASGLIAFAEASESEEPLSLSGDRSVFAAYTANQAVGQNTFFNDGSHSWADSSAHLTFGAANSNHQIVSALAAQDDIRIASVHTDMGLTQLEYGGVQVGGPKIQSAGESVIASSLVGFGIANRASDDKPGYVEPFDGGIGEFIVFPQTLDGNDRWRVNAFLMSKWQDHVVFDASEAASAVSLSVVNALSKPVLMLGGLADDTLTAGAHGSVLVGGAGKDSLIGGDGRDRFIVGEGDEIHGFTDPESLKSDDVLDLTGLLPLGDVALESCLFLSPSGSDTLVSMSSNCIGQDFVSGSDFEGVQFLIKDRSFTNADIPLLWGSGALHTANHRPGAITASLVFEDAVGQQLDIAETDPLKSRQTLYVDFSGGEPFQGLNFRLPLRISGSALPGEDFDLWMKRIVDPDDEALVHSLSNGEYTYAQLLSEVSDETLVKLGLLKEESGSGLNQFSLFYRDNVLSTYQPGVPVYIPAQLTLNNALQKRIELELVMLKDQAREAEEDLVIELGGVPEYFDLAQEKSQLTVTISDGLDRVFLTNSKETIYEGSHTTFKLHREGSIDQKLVVDVVLSGSAVNGQDYVSFPAQVTFLEGESEVAVPLTALADDTVESIELAELRLVSGEGYEIDSESNIAQIFIHDQASHLADTDGDQLPDSWEIAAGLDPNVSNLGSNGFTDSDNDGLSDFDEYIRGSNPLVADTSTEGQDALLNYQTVRSTNLHDNHVPVGLNRIIDIPLDYITSDGTDQASGIQLLLKYNADDLEFVGLVDVLQKSHLSTDMPVAREEMRGDYKLFSHYVSVSWASAAMDWPGLPLPTRLLSARFKLLSTVEPGSKLIVGIDSEAPAEGYAFKRGHIEINAASPSQLASSVGSEIGNEGIALARHYTGLKSVLTPAQDGAKDQLTDDPVSEHFEVVGVQYDVDGDGVVNPLTDAVLIHRFLSEQSLSQETVNKILGSSTTQTAADITARILEIRGVQ